MEKNQNEYEMTSEIYESMESQHFALAGNKLDGPPTAGKLDGRSPAACNKLNIVLVVMLLILLLIVSLILIIQIYSLVISNDNDSNIMASLSSSSNSCSNAVTDTNPSSCDKLIELLQMVQNSTQLINDALNYSSISTTKTLNDILIAANEILSYQNLTQLLPGIVNALSNINDTVAVTADNINDVLLGIVNLQVAAPSYNLTNCNLTNYNLTNYNLTNSPPSFNLTNSTPSCKSLYSNLLPSGYYYINGTHVYCNMGQLCGSGGGWTRLAYLNMSDSTENCPSGFRLYTSGGVRACGRPVSSGGSCSSLIFTPSESVSYSEICGKVVGYQYGTPDAAYTTSNSINGAYVDGVSITRGSPRQHVWTLIAGNFENDFYSYIYNCPCNNPAGAGVIPSFVGSDYYCESANPNNTASYSLHSSDPLWDGEGCGGQETACCTAPDLPWFHRDYGNDTVTDYIELRVCGDEGTANEDVPISFYEIYVK